MKEDLDPKCFRLNTNMRESICLGTSIARPLMAKKQIEIAHQTGADAVTMGQQEKVMTKLDLSWDTWDLMEI